MTAPKEETSLRALLVSAHEKLDAVLRIQHTTTADRMTDRAAIQRHGRKIATLEHQVALLTEAAPGIASWQPDTVDTPLPLPLGLEGDADLIVSNTAADLLRQRRWALILAILMFAVGVIVSGGVALLLQRH